VEIVYPGDLKVLRDFVESDPFFAVTRTALDLTLVHVTQKATFQHWLDAAGDVGFVSELAGFEPGLTVPSPISFKGTQQLSGWHGNSSEYERRLINLKDNDLMKRA
jgi:hypothetical protein